MRVGITRSKADLEDGGIFQYEQAFLAALGEISPRVSNELVYISATNRDLVTLARTAGLSFQGLPVQVLDEVHKRRMDYVGPQEISSSAIDPDRIFYDRAGADRLRKCHIDLLLQLSPVSNAFSMRLPFVCPIFDLNHRLQPEFPEVSEDGEFQRREYFYINTCRYATLVLADSPIGRDAILQYYGHYIDAERIRILPYYPPIARRPAPCETDRLRVAQIYSLPDRYFFYPAQFWRHKNHAAILEALNLVRRQHGVALNVVFCGSYADYHRARNYDELQALIDRLGVRDNIAFLGSVPDADMPALYAMSAGLVMPTFFGPTNIPPLEAWLYERPVICSNISGIREQIGNAGLLVDPRSPAELADAMLKIWTQESAGDALVKAGRERLATFNWRAFVDGVEEIVVEACDRVRAGRSPAYPSLPYDSEPTLVVPSELSGSPQGRPEKLVLVAGAPRSTTTAFHNALLNAGAFHGLIGEDNVDRNPEKDKNLYTDEYFPTMDLSIAWVNSTSRTEKATLASALEKEIAKLNFAFGVDAGLMLKAPHYVFWHACFRGNFSGASLSDISAQITFFDRRQHDASLSRGQAIEGANGAVRRLRPPLNSESLCGPRRA